MGARFLCILFRKQTCNYCIWKGLRIFVCKKTGISFRKEIPRETIYPPLSRLAPGGGKVAEVFDERRTERRIHMNRKLTIHPGVIANEEDIVRALKEKGFYSSGIPRKAERGRTETLPRQLSSGAMFEQYAEALTFGRENEFLKSLSHGQFDALCASLRKGK